VFYQLKILTTAVFSVAMLSKRLDCFKWTSLIVLVGGVSLVQLSGLKDDGDNKNGNYVVGLTAVLVACCSSGFAGVYFEKVLKDSDISVWMRNIQLAIIGVLAGLGGVYYKDAAQVGKGGG